MIFVLVVLMMVMMGMRMRMRTLLESCIDTMDGGGGETRETTSALSQERIFRDEHDVGHAH